MSGGAAEVEGAERYIDLFLLLGRIRSIKGGSLMHSQKHLHESLLKTLVCRCASAFEWMPLETLFLYCVLHVAASARWKLCFCKMYELLVVYSSAFIFQF